MASSVRPLTRPPLVASPARARSAFPPRHTWRPTRLSEWCPERALDPGESRDIIRLRSWRALSGRSRSLPSWQALSGRSRASARGGGRGRFRTRLHNCFVYFVYIVRCVDGSLYTGFTRDTDDRVAVHNAGKGAKYTASRLP